MKEKRTLAVLQIILAIGFMGFWTLYFLEPSCTNATEQCLENPSKTCMNPLLACERYRAFENSFPLGDLGYITPLLLIGAVGLLRNKKYGVVCSLMAASALIFLGLLDVSFNILQQRYSISLPDALMNGFINTVCVVFGPILAWRTAKMLSF
ncbi:MAG: hypothetical protein LDLANPLL_01470 [Turneriella sp.]|nr:hypothetical protein [Turneriella sp.]